MTLQKVPEHDGRLRLATRHVRRQHGGHARILTLLWWPLCFWMARRRRLRRKDDRPDRRRRRRFTRAARIVDDAADRLRWTQLSAGVRRRTPVLPKWVRWSSRRDAELVLLVFARRSRLRDLRRQVRRLGRRR